MNEFDYIRRFLELLPTTGEGVVVGPGDDCAVLRRPLGAPVVTVDMAVEGVHFPSPTTRWEDVGFRTATAAISDIGAMGGEPTWMVVSMALPRSWGFDEPLEHLVKGVGKAAAVAGTPVVGGDLTRTSGPLVLSFTVGGEFVEGSKPLLRSGGHPGDIVAVTGTVGGAFAAVAWMAGEFKVEGALVPQLEAPYWRPTARIAEGKRLAQTPGVTSAIDISDGLAQDLGHICAASGLDAIVDFRAIPRSPALQTLELLYPDVIRKALMSGGDDYELLCLVAPEALEGLIGQFREEGLAPLTPIGRVVPGKGAVRLEGADEDWSSSGYTHSQE